MSPVSLAHAAPAAPPFNALFYATAATVLPVLFLAVAVQGNFYQTLLQAIAADRRRRAATSQLLFLIAGLVVAYGAGGEIIAIASLYEQKPAFGAQSAVLPGIRMSPSRAAALGAVSWGEGAWRGLM